MVKVVARPPRTVGAVTSGRANGTENKAAGIPVNPVVWYAVGMTPAATVSGATPARTKNRTAGTPSRSRASARDMLPGLLPAVCVLDMM
jgi:hypothetical protein